MPYYKSDTEALNAANDRSLGPKSIRANNPGALNAKTGNGPVIQWIKNFPGYVGYVRNDGYGNYTAVFRTPDDGIAAWLYLLREVYSFGPNPTLRKLAVRYSGGDQKLIKQYLHGWTHSTGWDPDAVFSLGDLSHVQILADALFLHESGKTGDDPWPDKAVEAAFNRVVAGRLDTEITPTQPYEPTLKRDPMVNGWFAGARSAITFVTGACVKGLEAIFTFLGLENAAAAAEAAFAVLLILLVLFLILKFFRFADEIFTRWLNARLVGPSVNADPRPVRVAVGSD